MSYRMVWLPTVCIIMGAVGTAAPEAGKRVRLSSPVTHSDWILAENPPPEWGPEGVRQILDRARECGWSRVYWRCFDAGKSMYQSQLLEPFDQGELPNYWSDHNYTQVIERMARIDYGEFDTFKQAVEYGRQIGLEVHAWLTINEDDHGYGWRSRFAREHPEFRWVRRDGRPYNSQLSFAFPQVRAYKLALLREILAYKPDGVFFDWIRTGDVRDNPQTDAEGIANYGYETPNLRRFRAQHGVDAHEVPNSDERWVDVRAWAQTQFMREARAIIRQSDPAIPVSVMVHHPWAYRGAPDDTPYADSRRGLLCDVRAWAREGLIDAAMVAGYYRGDGTPRKGFEWLKAETEGRVDLWLMGWLTTPEQFATESALAEELGAVELLLWESNYVGLPPAKAETVKAMSDYVAGR